MLHPFKSLVARVVLALACTVLTLNAQRSENAPELSEKFQETVQKLSPLFEAKKWDEAVGMIDAAAAKAEPVSFDRAFLLQLKAQILGSKGDFAAAVIPLEESVKIADQLRLFRFARVLPMTEQDSLINLASLYLQSVETPGATLEMRRAGYEKALHFAKRLVEGRKPTLEAQYTVARILYGLASMDGAKVDMTLMKEAKKAAEDTLLLTIKPKEEHYTLLLACLQQLGENERVAQVVELLLAQNPNSKTLWPMLLGTYVGMQSNKDISADLRAVLALERAQAAGQMKSPRDNFSLAGLYYNMSQYAQAADILDKGLKSGTIENDIRNWELLAACYQQLNKEDKAIETFSEAIKRFPKNSSLEQQLGNIYYNSDRQPEAYKHLLAAVDKGLERPAQTLVLCAYLAMEMKRLDDALVVAERAVQADSRSSEAQSILKVINDSIKERNQFLNKPAAK